jgi:hypothetical protein
MTSDDDEVRVPLLGSLDDPGVVPPFVDEELSGRPSGDACDTLPEELVRATHQVAGAVRACHVWREHMDHRQGRILARREGGSLAQRLVGPFAEVGRDEHALRVPHAARSSMRHAERAARREIAGSPVGVSLRLAAGVSTLAQSDFRYSARSLF